MHKVAILAFALAIGSAEAAAIASLARQTSQTFTLHGEVETATDANGNTTTHTYDALGRRIRTTRPEVDGAAATTHTGYDLVGNVIHTTDARGNLTHYTVDALNRRTGQTDPADGEGVVYTQSWTYDQAGNAIGHRDRRGIVSETRFDKENRILGTRRAGLTLSTLSRDADGNVRTALDALGRLTTTTVDKASRKVLEVRPGATESWTWTTENDLATHTDADGRIQRFTFDARRQLIAETNAAGETTEHTYDGAGHRLTSQRPLGDADHRWVSTWDEGDRLASVSDPQGHTTTYRYDAHGNRTAILDANNHTTAFAYDARHRLIRKTYPTVGTEMAVARWTWDADDNEASHTTPNGALITSTHDALNRRTDQTIDTVAAGEVRSTHWVFDGNANLTAIRETVQDAGERSEARRYDPFDRIEGVTDQNGKTLGYGYDPVGNRTHLTDADGQITDYTYDALNHNRKVTVPGHGATTQTWLPSGRLETIARPDAAQGCASAASAGCAGAAGSTTTHTYDVAGRLETITHANPGGVIAQLHYRYDLNGNRIEQKETNGAVTENSEQTTGYEYDRADRLVTVREPARTLSYTLDPVGNRTTETVTNTSAVLVSQSTLSYDERDRLTERSDPVQGLIISQSWDADGNRTGQTINGETRTFTYDARDRLVTLQQPGAPPLSFDYDSHGLRTKKAQGAAETRYQYDQSSLIAETNAIGNTRSRLHYGATQLLARTEAGSTPSYRNYLLDALASPIVLTHQDGSISARTRYDAFGEILAQQGTAGQLTTPNPNAATATRLTTDQQPIGFTGYQKDEESGLYYAKARYYDPTVARFTTEDPEAGKADMPPSLHRYLYAYANPTVYVDPTGRIQELADGANALNDFNRYLRGLANEQSNDWLGHSISAGVGVGRGFVGLTEGALRTVNAGANLGVLAIDAIDQRTNTNYRGNALADESLREIMLTGRAIGEFDRYLQDDGLFKSYDHAVETTSYALEGQNAEISDVFSALTTVSAPTRVGTLDVSASASNALGTARNAAAKLRDQARSFAEGRVAATVVEGSANQPAVRPARESSVADQTLEIRKRVQANVAQTRAGNAASDFDKLVKSEGRLYEQLEIWPPNSGQVGPVQVLDLQPGAIIDRFGLPHGRFLSPQGTPFSARALPSAYEAKKPYFMYEVIQPIPSVTQSRALPWFGQRGMGVQYELPRGINYLDPNNGYVRLKYHEP